MQPTVKRAIQPPLATQSIVQAIVRCSVHPPVQQAVLSHGNKYHEALETYTAFLTAVHTGGCMMSYATNVNPGYTVLTAECNDLLGKTSVQPSVQSSVQLGVQRGVQVAVRMAVQMTVQQPSPLHVTTS